MTSFQLNGPALRGQRNAANFIMLSICVVAALIAISALVAVLVYLVYNGARYINWHVLTSDPDDGIRSSIMGSLVLIGIASSIGLPVGILGGIYQLESKGRFAFLVRFLTDVLNSVPSIIIGVFIYVLVVIPVAARFPGHGASALAGGLALAIIMIPTIMRTTEEILRLVPTSLREGSLALGAGRARTMFSIVLPAARNGVITGIMLALARIAGETAPLLFTIGGNDVLSVKLSARPPFVHGLSDQIDSLPYRIYQDIINGDPNLNHQAMAAALILVVLIFGMSLITRLATSNKLLEEK